MPEKQPVGIPTVSGITQSFKDWGIGIVAGIGYLLASQLFGGLGLIAAPLLIGSMIKGDRGKIIAVMVGFMAIAMTGMASSRNSGANGEVM